MRRLVALCAAALSVGVVNPLHAKVIQVKGAGVSARIDDQTGDYSVHRDQPEQDWSGSLGKALDRSNVGTASDSVGKYDFINFGWTADGKMNGEIDVYADKPVVAFTDSCVEASAKPPADFPDFTKIPVSQHVFSYANQSFAPPSFRAEVTGGGPWILFDDDANTVMISPDSNFMTASLHGDGVTKVSSGFVAPLANLPAGFAQRTMLAFGKGIGQTMQVWGDSFLKSINAKRPTNDADTGLKYMGYWTDNGADYYYHFDPEKGYAGTLLAVADQLKKLGINIQYMQLDSWWYQKTTTTPTGKQGRPKMNNNLPIATWNCYGGLWEYTAHKDLFPDGLDAFQKKLGLPMITHNRWIDVASPYHQKYKISGLGAIDPKWWDDIVDYLKANGVMTYEQDWLDQIYLNSPEFQSVVGVGELFMDNMARATKERGLTMQYCMGLPRHYLQGAKYENLTSVRVCGDRFARRHWNASLYVSQLASVLGEWPWVDVFMSRETPNMILATMTGGMVGFGDALDTFDVDNLKMVERPDGVLVKPDHPMVPIDAIYLADANKKSVPMIATTTSGQANHLTHYVFAFPRATSQAEVQFSAADVGVAGDAYVYDVIAKTGKHIAAGEAFTDQFGTAATTKPDDQPWKFYVVAPVSKNGIALIGDGGKFASMGRQRIADIQETDQDLKVTVAFAAGETTVTLHGYAPAAPNPTASEGRVQNVQFDPATKHFSFEVQSADSARAVIDLK